MLDLRRLIFGAVFFTLPLIALAVPTNLSSGLADSRSAALIIDLPPDAVGAEYRPFLERNASLVSKNSALAVVLKTGALNLDWLKLINDHRPASAKLSFTSKANVLSYPLNAPKIYNEQIVADDYAKVVAQLPAAMKAVLIDGSPMTPDVPATEADYLRFGWAVDRVYQSAARWTMLEGYLGQLAMRQAQDVRGYYFLSQLSDRPARLGNYKNLTQAEQNEIRDWVSQMSVNNRVPKNQAVAAIDRAITTNNLESLYEKWEGKSAQNYQSFFDIPVDAVRTDVTRSSTEFHVPFQNPANPAVRAFLADNIQDEWKMGPWQLTLDFLPSARAHVEFEKGALPHVNGLGGDIITMDDNAPLTEYDVQWTIRHEFGHVLGFPDCYLEFYDVQNKIMVNYQLDTTNLMCSRKGHLQQRHVDELNRVYAREPERSANRF